MRFHPLRLITVVSPEQPHPFAPQPTAIRRRITATTGESAGAPATVLSPHGFCRSDSPSRLPDPRPIRDADPLFRFAPSHVPPESLDWAHAAYMPDTTWAVSGYLPDSSRENEAPPVLMSSK